MTPTQQASLFLAATRWCALVGIDSTGNAKEREEAYQVLRRVVHEIAQRPGPRAERLEQSFDVLHRALWQAAAGKVVEKDVLAALKALNSLRPNAGETLPGFDGCEHGNPSGGPFCDKHESAPSQPLEGVAVSVTGDVTPQGR